MGQGYMIVNGEKVEGRTLSFDSDGVHVSKENEMPQKIQNNVSNKKSIFLIGFVVGCCVGYGVKSILAYLRKEE